MRTTHATKKNRKQPFKKMLFVLLFVVVSYVTFLQERCYPVIHVRVVCTATIIRCVQRICGVYGMRCYIIHCLVGVLYAPVMPRIHKGT